MPRNGSGVFNLVTGINPVVSGSTIATNWANTTLNDVATALTQSVSSDGQTTLTGNLNLGGQRVTNVATGIGTNDAVNLAQVTALLTPATLLDVNSPIFTTTGLLTTSTGALSATTFTVATDQTAVFTVGKAFTFQNTRLNGQIYSVLSSSFLAGTTTVAFSPALLAADVFTAGVTIYLAVGGPQTKTSFSEIEFPGALSATVVNGRAVITTGVPSFTSVANIAVGSIFMGDPATGADVNPGDVVQVGGGGGTFNAWSTTALPATIVNNAAYNGTTYVATGINTGLSSTDATAWTVRAYGGTASAGGLGNFNVPIIWNATNFLVVDANLSGTTAFSYRYSTNGSVWTSAFSPSVTAAGAGTTLARNIVPFGAGVVMVNAIGGTAGGNTVLIESSTNTVGPTANWSALSTQSFAIGNYVVNTAVSNGTTILIMTQSNLAIISTNGTSWTTPATPANPIAFSAATTGNTFAPNMLVANGLFIYPSSTTTAYSSPDGTNWTLFATPLLFRSISFGNGMYFAIGSDGRTYTATVLGTWTLASQYGPLGYPIFGNGKWFSLSGNLQYNYTIGASSSINVYNIPAAASTVPTTQTVPNGTYRMLGGNAIGVGISSIGLWKRES